MQKLELYHTMKIFPSMGKTIVVSVILMMMMMLLFPVGYTADLGSDTAALLALRSAVGGQSLPWDLTQSTPCAWRGVLCQLGRVTELRLPGVGLSGELPATGVIGNLTSLRTLSLRFNALFGRVPYIASCTELRSLFLQGNMFSGEIPPEIFGLQSLVRLNLAGNRLSGRIPPGLGNLTRLGTLLLEDNRLTGTIPPDLNLRSLVEFNVSSNRLNGSVPLGLSRFPASSFSGNSLCGGPLIQCPDNDDGINGNSTSKKLSGGAIAGIVIGCVAGLLITVTILILLLKRKKISVETSYPDAEAVAPVKQDVPQTPGGGEGDGKSRSLVFFGNAPKVFDVESLLTASAEVLGKGVFGTAYKAGLEMGTCVAVKRLRDVGIREREFREKVEFVGGMDHENLVPLRAYYYSGHEKLLVSDYMPMGSLSALLHGNKGGGRTPLNWETRSGIALGAARGIAYLHSRTPTFSHGNITSSNILLTNSYEARISDFSLASIVGIAAAASAPNCVSSYRAPEITDMRKVSQKADVFSFGVLLLELLTGKAPGDEDGIDLPLWVQSVVREGWTSEVFDFKLLRYQNVEEEMVELLQLAVDCTVQHPLKRPSMAEATEQIKKICFSSSRKMGELTNDE